MRGSLRFDWKSATTGKRIGYISLAVFLFAVSAILIIKPVYSLYREHRISSNGIDTFAFIDKSHTTKAGTGICEVKYYFYARDVLHEGTRSVNCQFEQHVKTRLQYIPVRYCKDDPSLSRIRYSAIYNLNSNFDNNNGTGMLSIIIGAGFFFGALFIFPWTALKKN